MRLSPVSILLGLRRFPIRTILDIGANRGQFARRARRLFPQARLYCFEPLEEPFEALRRWSEGQGGRVQALQVALGERPGVLPLHEHVDHDASSSFLKTTPEEEQLYPLTRRQSARQMEVTTLDQAIVDNGIPLEDDVWVKMDVQGFEDRVIRGGQATLRRARACLVEVGVVPLYDGQATFESISDQLRRLGYGFQGVADQVHDRHGAPLYLDALFVRDAAPEKPTVSKPAARGAVP